MKIYLIVGERGAYSDRVQWNVCAATSEYKAEELMTKIKELDAYNCIFSKKLEEFKRIFSQEQAVRHAIVRVVRPSPTPEFTQYQTLASLKSCPEEDKEKFKQLQSEHLKKIEVYNQQYAIQAKFDREIYKEHSETSEAYVKANYNPPAHLEEVFEFVRLGEHSYYDENEYSIEVCDLLE